MTIAGNVSSVLGIEYDNTLVNIASKTAGMLGINNCEFVCADFNKWCVENKGKKFDMIFSFAVHYWLNAGPEDYAETIDSLLNTGGYCILESQNIYTVDKNFADYTAAFSRRFTKCYDGSIKDDWIIERKWAVFKKE